MTDDRVSRHGPRFEMLARNTLDDGFDASAALVDGHIYLRGYATCTTSGTLSGLELWYPSLEREDLCHCCDKREGRSNASGPRRVAIDYGSSSCRRVPKDQEVRTAWTPVPSAPPV